MAFTPSSSSTTPPRVVVDDLRGVRVHATGDPVLLDRSGARARRLRTAGRVIGVVFLGWFCGLVLAGLGVLPASGVPFGSVVAADSAPPVLRQAPVVTAPTRADLAPAKTLAQVRAGRASPALVPPGTIAALSTTTGAAPTTTARTKRKVTTPAKTQVPAKRKLTVPAASPAVTAGPGNGKGYNNGRPTATTTGTVTTTPAAPASQGKSTTAPGKTKTTAAPTSTTTTAPGASGTAPGHSTASPGQGSGNGHTKTTP